MAKKTVIRSIYRRASRRMGKTTIPVMGVVTGGSLLASILASSAGQAKPDDNPVKWMMAGQWNNALTKLQFNMGKPTTYTPVIIPLAVWGIGRAVLGKVRLTRKISLF